MNFLIDSEQIPLMEAEGLIEKCHDATGYTSLVVVKKPGSGPVRWRIAHDLRELNKVTKLYYFGLPGPCSIAYRLAGSYYTTAQV